MKQEDRVKILQIFQANNPKPTTELIYQTPFELLIAVILSAQATDVGVNKATVKLFAVANTPQAIINLGLEGLKSYIKTIGLFNTKANNILATCQKLLVQYNHLNLEQGEIPNTRNDLEGLFGVGRKTANVVLNTVFKQPVIAVDTHIFRVCNRMQFAIGKNVLSVEKKLLAVVPDEFKQDIHHWLILHGRYTCTARKPKCYSCLVSALCMFDDKEKCL